jgi:hypothetical protein
MYIQTGFKSVSPYLTKDTRPKDLTRPQGINVIILIFIIFPAGNFRQH